MRGLKQNMQLAKYQNNWVASFTDAWIETKVLEDEILRSDVASFTDAWIETFTSNPIIDKFKVASFTDAWIETWNKQKDLP